MKTKGNQSPLTKEQIQELRREAKADRESMNSLIKTMAKNGTLVEDNGGGKAIYTK